MKREFSHSNLIFLRSRRIEDDDDSDDGDDKKSECGLQWEALLAKLSQLLVE